MVVEKVVAELFKEFPSPKCCDHRYMQFYMACRMEDRLIEILKPLGLGTKRASRLIRMTTQYLDSELLHGDKYEVYPIKAYSGCGEYARDAWILFVLKKPCDPKDRLLKKYSVTRFDKEKIYG
jgi:hypothetical protein